MEGEKLQGAGDAMEFSWSTDWEQRARATSPVVCHGEAAAAAAMPEDSIDSMILVPGPRVLMSGLREGDCRGDDALVFINAGGSAIEGCGSSTAVSGDSFFEGGDVIETDESIVEGGDYPSLYHTARYGNFCYKVEGLAPGEYFLDLHFAEIVNTYGPKGIRAFDVLVQEEKILSELDVYSVVGGNRPLQILGIRVESNGVIMIDFKGVRGSPMVSGICIRKAPALSADSVKNGNVVCKKCSADIEVSPIQTRMGKLISKYERQIEELNNKCSMKSDECYVAWSSVTSANQELEKLKMEHHQKVIQSDTLEQTFERQTDQLRDVSQSYQHDKKLWAAAISNLETKIKAMKQEQSLLSLEAHECANSIPDLSRMIGAIQALVAQCEDLKLKYNEEMTKRKKLYNIVQEAKGNIRVFCRCRPLNKSEISSGYKTIVDFDGAKDGDIGIVNGGTTKKTFKFDRVYTPKDDQADVYADASPLVTSVLDGYNACIFAYGQTGTGKTFTMEGTERNRGVNYRTLEELFKIATERKETVTYSISVSVLEVYNEQIRDLLATSPSSKKLEIKQAGEGSHHVPGIVEAKVENIKEVWDVLQAGSNARAVGSNNVNEHSSRSHCMLCIMVRAKNLMNGECTRSKLWLVDLAGSERLAKTDVQGERLKEAQNINRSLSALGDVISALAMKSSHIPYRNSKLTHLLQDSLGGDSKALMFVQISPSDNDVSETLSSLNFASRVHRIELGPAKKQVDTAELQKVKQMLEKAKQEARLKDDSFRKLEENCQNLENKAKLKEQLYKSLQEKVKELESQLDYKMQSQITSEKQHYQLSGKLKEKEEMCTSLQRKIEDLECQLRKQHQSDSEIMLLQQKIKELELKLKEQEHQRSVVELKACKLGEELLEMQRMESMLQLKVIDLENNLQGRTSALQATSMVVDPVDCVRIATPREGRASFSREEAMSENEHNILRSSDSINKAVFTDNASFPGVREAVNEKKRKGDGRNVSIGEQENSIAATQNVARKRSLPSEPRVKRMITEQAKNVGRPTSVSRMTAGTQKVAPNPRVIRQQQGGNKTRGWVR